MIHFSISCWNHFKYRLLLRKVVKKLKFTFISEYIQNSQLQQQRNFFAQFLIFVESWNHISMRSRWRQLNFVRNYLAAKANDCQFYKHRIWNIKNWNREARFSRLFMDGIKWQLSWIENIKWDQGSWENIFENFQDLSVIIGWFDVEDQDWVEIYFWRRLCHIQSCYCDCMTRSVWWGSEQTTVINFNVVKGICQHKQRRTNHQLSEVSS